MGRIDDVPVVTTAGATGNTVGQPATRHGATLGGRGQEKRLKLSGGSARRSPWQDDGSDAPDPQRHADGTGGDTADCQTWASGQLSEGHWPSGNRASATAWSLPWSTRRAAIWAHAESAPCARVAVPCLEFLRKKGLEKIFIRDELES